MRYVIIIKAHIERMVGGRSMKRVLCIIGVVLLTIVLSVGCSAQKSVSNDMEYSTSAASPAAQPDAETANEPDGGLATRDVGTLISPDYGGRKVIRNIYISIESDAFDEHLAVLLENVQQVGGYVESSNVDGKKPEAYNEPGRYGSFIFRIPVDKADLFAQEAKGYGTLVSSSENAEDISSQYFDMETRLSVLRTQLERLTSILVKTDNLADVIQLESEIARVTIEIEELTTQLRRYDGLVDYATVTVSIAELRPTSGPAAEKTVGERIALDFENSLYGVGTFLVNAFVWFVGALPVLVLVCGIGTGIFFIVRGVCKHDAKRAQKRKAKEQAQIASKNNNDIGSGANA